MNYSNSNIRIVLFGIRSFSKTKYIRIFPKKPNIFGIQSVLSIPDNTASNTDTYLVVIDGGCFLNVMPAEAVPVEDEEDLPPPAEEAARVVPHHAGQQSRGQRAVQLAANRY